MYNRPNTAALPLVLSALISCVANAATVSVKFLDSTDTAWGAASAGAPGFAQPNWNFMQTDWSGNTPNDALFASGLIGSAGGLVSGFAGSLLQNVAYEAPNVDPLHYDSANTWRSGRGNATPDDTLMNGYLDDGGDNQPYANLSLNTIPGIFETYSVVLYVNGDDPNQGMGRYWLESWTDSLLPGTVITDQVAIPATSLYSGTFNLAGSFPMTGTPANVTSGQGNYIVFTGITARNIRIRDAGNGDPEDAGRGPLNGFQLVDTTNVPEPSIGLLSALGMLGFMRRKR